MTAIDQPQSLTTPLRRILVTGSSRGIGRAIALQLAREGFQVLVHGRADSDALRATLADIAAAGGQAAPLIFDIGDRAATRAAIEQAQTDGALYGVVCNAGIARDNAFPAMTDEDWDGVIQTNLDSFYNIVQPLVMPMVRAKKGGRIVTLSSVSGIAGNRGQVNYSAAKAGIIGATKALALELASRNITVNCVAPGLIDTEMLQGVEIDEALKLVPAKRLGKPEEIAAVVAFLCSDSAAYVTRQVIAVNGGMV
ncbi:3-ketoacyl-ACP reductase FabG2 [Permianibacter fluminis]|uniref:3-ketoacyl-ACP reductase FabG2 n=1 Tax=Permianibacter fluminis TaxID=2738515 RepID=UPI001553A6E7|nr:3-ketoacyl-ACP reductase FabG2 [Permianibacter fluminis]